MTLLGLAGVLLNLGIVYTALTNLSRVDAGSNIVTKIDAAQSWFQDADMMHDTLHADVLQSVVEPGPGEQSQRDVLQHAARFRADMTQVERGGLTSELADAVHGVRPLQEQYVSEAVRLVQLPAESRRAALPRFSDMFTALEGQQARITMLLAQASAATRAHADHDEQLAKWEVVGASGAALVGLLLLTELLARRGSQLALLAARERTTAETLQHSLLPDRLPVLPGVGLAARYVPGGVGVDVGGDWYDVIVLPGGAVGLVMGDVAGHDLRAAAVMGQLRNALRAYAGEGLTPPEALERLNRLCHQHDVDEMATCVFAVLDPVSSTLRIANAGHYPLLMRRPDGVVSFLQQPVRPPLGAVRDPHFTEQLVHFEPGSLLLLYTDGLVERRGVGVEQGLARLEAAASSAPADLSQLCDHILAVLLDRDRPVDDVALLAVQPASLLGPRLRLQYAAESVQLVALRRTLQRWLTEAGADPSEAYEVIVATSEAATNAIEHAYGPAPAFFEVSCEFRDGVVEVSVRDRGVWRSSRGLGRGRGRGLTLIEGLMDEVDIVRGEDGSTVTFRRALARPAGVEPVRSAEVLQ